MSAGNTNDRIVWIDCEMTGLDLNVDALIEVSAVVTDFNLTVLGEGVDVVIRPPAEAVDQMGDFVRQMHTRSGLINELDAGVSMADAEQLVLDYVRTWAPEAGKALLAGNSVGTDKGFLVRDMPNLVDHLHYRLIDVSTLKELARHWYPRVYIAAPEKHGGHRALADILESIDELRYYRAAMLVPEPGLSSQQAREISAQIVADSVSGTITVPAGH